MNEIIKHPILTLGTNFIPAEYLPDGKDEYYLRNRQNPSNGRYRQLTAHEIEVLVRNRNTSDDWNKLLVSNAFNPELVKNCKFFGLVRIGNLEPYYLEFHDLRVPVGLYNSTIINCDFGDNVVVDNVNYFAYYITGDEVIIANVNEIATSDHAKFGNGILKEGETEDIRIWLEICNENGGRSVLPFDGMLPGDAWLWSRNRDNAELQRRFREMTEKKFDNFRGYYGMLGNRTVIKNCSIVKDVKTGTDAYLKGANKLKNLTINSSAEAPTQIGEGCELVNGIIGFGCRIFYGVKAVRFIMGSNSQLKYGARLINSFLGDNATISCCEVLNSLIFPAHEQHHNNSFLIAATIEGQSNIAAGATIGSNHNSRGADGELVAGRGFWPALCTSIKHNSKFAPFTLLAKADYPNELNISLPFSLVSNDTAHDRLVIMPAYWFMYNMYALARNAWKVADRDKRTGLQQELETNFLAPDTVNAMFEALPLLEKIYGKALLSPDQAGNNHSGEEYLSVGKLQLTTGNCPIQNVETDEGGFEHSRRKCQILKLPQAYQAYRDFILMYSAEILLEFIGRHPGITFENLAENYAQAGERKKFVNAGGQLLPGEKLDSLKQQVVSYEIVDWDDIHRFYVSQAEQYAGNKLLHALASLRDLRNPATFSREFLHRLFEEYLLIKEKYNKEITESKLRDYSNPFRQMVYENMEEMKAVLGKPGDNAFIRMQNQQLGQLKLQVKSVLQEWKLV